MIDIVEDDIPEDKKEILGEIILNSRDYRFREDEKSRRYSGRIEEPCEYWYYPDWSRDKNIGCLFEFGDHISRVTTFLKETGEETGCFSFYTKEKELPRKSAEGARIPALWFIEAELYCRLEENKRIRVI